ncbi:hypothetical protein BG000_006082, partial [Podila horticola]
MLNPDRDALNDLAHEARVEACHIPVYFQSDFDTELAVAISSRQGDSCESSDDEEFYDCEVSHAGGGDLLEEGAAGGDGGPGGDGGHYGGNGGQGGNGGD